MTRVADEYRERIALEVIYANYSNRRIDQTCLLISAVPPEHLHTAIGHDNAAIVSDGCLAKACSDARWNKSRVRLTNRKSDPLECALLPFGNLGVLVFDDWSGVR